MSKKDFAFRYLYNLFITIAWLFVFAILMIGLVEFGIWVTQHRHGVAVMLATTTLLLVPLAKTWSEKVEEDNR